MLNFSNSCKNSEVEHQAVHLSSVLKLVRVTMATVALVGMATASAI